MYDIDYIIVPTSNCDYQEWQCRFLNWSRKQVKQTGKLIFLISEDTPDRPFPEFDDAEVIRLPNWALEWENKHNDWWGGIPNKYNSIKWMLENMNIGTTETILFLDPDMIFVSPVTSSLDPCLNPSFIEGQKWEGFNPEFLHGVFSRKKPDVYSDPFMCPYITTINTLETLIDTYSVYSELARLSSNNWIAEMYGLYHAAKTHQIRIDVNENLGHCTQWWDSDIVEDSIENLPQIIHYPNEIIGTSGEIIWFKQNYTFIQGEELSIDYNDISSTLSFLLLQNLKKFRTDTPPIKVKEPVITVPQNKDKNLNLWYSTDVPNHLFRHYTGENGYISYTKWPGGFNNIRMSFELAVCIAYITNRTLILPDVSNYYLLEGNYNLSDFFDMSKVKIKTLTYEEGQLLDIPESDEYTFTDSTENLICNFTLTPTPNKILKGRKEIRFHEHLESTCWHFDKNLLGSFDNVIYSDKRSELKELIRTNVVYNSDIFNIAEKFINNIGSKFYAIHIRRNDFQYTNTFIDCDQIIENIREIVPKGSILYIATDHQDRTYFDNLQKLYTIRFYDDLKTHVPDDVPYHIMPIIEQLICTASETFIGMEYSTLSSYVYRLRHYMSENRPSTYNTNYYINTKKCLLTDIDTTLEEDSNFVANWYREYSDVATLESRKIFVSIASYKDNQIFATIESLAHKASNPKLIYVGIHLQDTEEVYNQLVKKCNEIGTSVTFKLLHTSPEKAHGVVWARNKVKDTLYNQEHYFLQIDSHTRFKENWDNILRTQHDSVDSNKVILTTYPNEYRIAETNEEYFRFPHNTALRVKGFISEDEADNRMSAENTPSLEDFEIKETRWVAAGFLFTEGKWLDDVKLPDNIRFSGEEDLQTHLSFLNGYNLHITSEAVVWHNYNNSPGTDLSKQHNPNLRKSDNASEYVNKALFDEKYVRSLNELEEFLGIYFKKPQFKKPKKIERSSNDSHFHILSWCIGDDFDSEHYSKMRQTSTLNNIDIKPLGIEKDYSGNTKDRFIILLEKLNNFLPEDIVMCTDGYDVLFNGDRDSIYQKFKEYDTDILISAEKLFTFQWDTWKDKFDTISTPYKYVNAGTYMGRVRALKQMVQEILSSDKYGDTELDQGLLGKWVYENLEDTKLVQLDKYCKVFWVTSGDWETLNKDLLGKPDIYNKETNTRPLVIHVPGMSTYSYVYDTVAKTILT